MLVWIFRCPGHSAHADKVGVLPGSALLALLLCCSGLLVNAGLWPTYPCTLGMGIATFDIMAQILSHPLVDVAHVWTTRWKTGTPNPWGSASSEDSLTVRAPGTGRSKHQRVGESICGSTYINTYFE